MPSKASPPTKREILSIDDFTRLALAGRAGTGPGIKADASYLIRSVLHGQAQLVEGADRSLKFTVSTAVLNRNNHRVNQNGWVLENYRKNPVVLWAHDDTLLSIAMATEVGVQGDNLVATVLFTPEGLITFNDKVFSLYTLPANSPVHFLNAVSAGWIPIDYEFVETENGWEIAFKEQELVEISCVPVPADPFALRRAAGMGVDIGPLRQWAAAILGDDRRYLVKVPAGSPEEIFKTAKHRVEEWHPGAKVLVVPNDFSVISMDPLAAAFQVEDSAGDLVTAGVSPTNVSTDLANKDASWAGPTLGDFTDKTWDELTAEERRKIAGHFAWASEMPPAAYGSLKLPHHRPSDGKVVWKGCTAAMSRLMQANTSIPDDDRRKVYNHLAAHYRAFEEEPPEFASAEGTTAVPTDGAKEIEVPVKVTVQLEATALGKPAERVQKPSTTPAPSAPAGSGNDATGERLVPGSREWRIRQLAK